MRWFDLITEAPIAEPGNMLYNDSILNNKCLDVYKQSWKVIGTIIINGLTYNITEANSGICYEVGMEMEHRTKDGSLRQFFDVVFHISLYDNVDLGNKLGYKNLHQVSYVMVKDTLRGNKIAKTMYRYLVKNLGYQILGDMIQYFGARRLWVSLSLDNDIIVDVVDLGSMEVIYENILLNRENEEMNFDIRLWSEDYTHANIRPILIDL